MSDASNIGDTQPTREFPPNRTVTEVEATRLVREFRVAYPAYHRFIDQHVREDVA